MAEPNLAGVRGLNLPIQYYVTAGQAILTARQKSRSNTALDPSATFCLNLPISLQREGRPCSRQAVSASCRQPFPHRASSAAAIVTSELLCRGDQNAVARDLAVLGGMRGIDRCSIQHDEGQAMLAHGNRVSGSNVELPEMCTNCDAGAVGNDAVLVKDCTTERFCPMGLRIRSVSLGCDDRCKWLATLLPPCREEECIDCWPRWGVA